MNFLSALLLTLLSACASPEPSVPPPVPSPKPVIQHENHSLNSNLQYDAFRLEANGCHYLASFRHESGSTTLQVVVGKTPNTSFQGSVPRDFIPCDLSEKDYQENLKLLLQNARSVIPGLKITGFESGTPAMCPLLKEFHRELAVASLKDEAMKDFRRYGESKKTLNSVFDHLVNEKNLFSDFIRIHREIGLLLRYRAGEKIFRERVRDSAHRTELLAAGGKPGDSVLSGAAVFHFDVPNGPI